MPKLRRVRMSDFLVLQAENEALRVEKKALEAQVETLRTIAYIDPLTGLLNRRAFFEELEASLKCSSKRNPVSLVMVDVDHFKRINDTKGHAVGDDVLRIFSKFLHDNIRPADILARIGGEELCIIMQNTDLVQAEYFGVRLCTGTEKRFKEPLAEGDDVVQVTASFGIAEATSHESMASLMKRADDALYASKRGGRNQVSVASQDSVKTKPKQGKGDRRTRRS